MLTLTPVARNSGPAETDRIAALYHARVVSSSARKEGKEEGQEGKRSRGHIM